MPRPNPHVILTLPNAGTSAIMEAVRLLKEQGYEVTEKPLFSPDGGCAALRKGDVTVTISWIRDDGLGISCRNLAFERETASLVELLRPLKRAP